MGKPWNKKETKQLLDLVEERGFRWLEISEILDRSQESIRMKYRNTVGETNTQNKLDNIDAGSLKENLPVIGIFDVETLPAVGYFWGAWQQNVYPEQIIHPNCLLSWAGKFLNQPEVYSDILTPKEAKDRDVARVANSLWKFLSNCDVIVAHNLLNFDLKVAKTAFLENGLPPLYYKYVDTLQIARKHFRFEHNKMEYLNRELGLRTKIENEGFRLWRKCSDGDPVALQTMLEYNEGDILALEDLYYVLQPYLRFFNAALYNTIEERQCPVCGSTDLEESSKHYLTPAGKWKMYRCRECGCLSRGKENLLTEHKKKSLLSTVDF